LNGVAIQQRGLTTIEFIIWKIFYLL
jgi:hypothetical protein